MEWTIDRATIASLPSQSNVLAANGTSQTPTWDGYDVTQLTIGGDRFGTDAGNYTATFTPTAKGTYKVTFTLDDGVIPVSKTVKITVA